MPVLKNVEVNWCSIQKPNTQFEPVWEVQVTLSKEQAKELLAAAKALSPKGLKLKQDEAGNPIIRLKRSVTRKDGSDRENQPPVCVDIHKEPFTKMIGNGSICNVQYTLIPWNNKFGSGVTTDFKGIQVIKLVEYGLQDGDEFEAEDNESPAPKDDKAFDDEDF